LRNVICFEAFLGFCEGVWGRNWRRERERERRVLYFS
jgi:hypothetical protein